MSNDDLSSGSQDDNGREPPESAVAFLYVEDLLQDYRGRRDADLLSACQCKFSVR